jgi:hypothetical protein
VIYKISELWRSEKSVAQLRNKYAGFLTTPSHLDINNPPMASFEMTSLRSHPMPYKSPRKPPNRHPTCFSGDLKNFKF